MTDSLASARGIPSLVWGPGQQRRLDLIVRQVGLDANRPWPRALVNGCGTGHYARRLAPYCDRIVGLDIEAAYLRQARRLSSSLLLSRAACERLPWPDACFDLVLSHEVLEHVADDRQAMAEMARVLKPQGRLALFLPNRWFPFETHGFYLQGAYYWGNVPLLNYLPARWRDRLAPHVRTYDASAVRRLCRGLPLRIVFWTRIWPGFDALGHSAPRWQTVVQSVRNACEASPLRFVGLSHFLVLQATAAQPDACRTA